MSKAACIKFYEQHSIATEFEFLEVPLSMSLRSSYKYIAPLYDIFVTRATASLRQRSLLRLPQQGAVQVLISGAGTGLDFPYLPLNHCYTSLDLTAAMQQRSRARVQNLDMTLVQGDSMVLPFENACFDYVVLHLIVAVVPNSDRCLAEAARVLKPGGKILIFDKFLQRGQRAWLRRGLSVITAKFATRLNVVFEDLLLSTPELQVVSDEPALAGGWFRLIELRKKNIDE